MDFTRLGEDTPINTMLQVKYALGVAQPEKLSRNNQRRIDETRSELLQLGLLRPHYTHDCRHCTFLGPYCAFGDDKYADLYHCIQGDEKKIPTVIARFSSEPSDNQSGVNFYQMPYLMEAQRRAGIAGLQLVPYWEDPT